MHPAEYYTQVYTAYHFCPNFVAQKCKISREFQSSSLLILIQCYVLASSFKVIFTNNSEHYYLLDLLYIVHWAEIGLQSFLRYYPHYTHPLQNAHL